MEVFFYKVPLCPRCLAAERHLKKVLSGRMHRLHIVDIFRHRQEARDAGVGFAPAIRVGDRVLSGFWLTEKRIGEFLEAFSG